MIRTLCAKVLDITEYLIARGRVEGGDALVLDVLHPVGACVCRSCSRRGAGRRGLGVRRMRELGWTVVACPLAVFALHGVDEADDLRRFVTP